MKTWMQVWNLICAAINMAFMLTLIRSGNEYLAVIPAFGLACGASWYIDQRTKK